MQYLDSLWCPGFLARLSQDLTRSLSLAKLYQMLDHGLTLWPTQKKCKEKNKKFLKLTPWTYSWGLNNNNVVIIKCNRYMIWNELVTKLNCACYFVTHPFSGVWGHVPPEYLQNLKLSNMKDLQHYDNYLGNFFSHKLT